MNNAKENALDLRFLAIYNSKANDLIERLIARLTGEMAELGLNDTILFSEGQLHLGFNPHGKDHFYKEIQPEWGGDVYSDWYSYTEVPLSEVIFILTHVSNKLAEIKEEKEAT